MRRHLSFNHIAIAAVLVAATAATTVALAPSYAAKPTLTTAATAAAAPARTVALGADIKPTGSQTIQQAITAFETTTGRQLAYTRDYLLWDSPFPTDYENWLAARGTMPHISVYAKTVGGTAHKWSEVATAQPGSAVYTMMKSWADRIKAFGYPVYLTFNHEPEAAASNTFGTTAEYIAAWRNFRHVFDVEGVTNAKWMWTMTAFAFLVPNTDRRYGWNWYPGDAYVDAIGADAYTAYTCDNPGGIWHPLSYQLAGFVTFGAQHPDKPMWLPEWGVVEDPAQPGRKAQWIADAQALFKGAAYAQFVGISYFNESRPGTACDWHITTSTSAKNAYTALASDDFYSGSAVPDVIPPTVSITAPAGGDTVADTVAVNATASDDVGVTGVSFQVDGTEFAGDTTAPYTASLDTTLLANGPHTLTAVATDAASNSTTSDGVAVTVTNAAPAGCAPTPDGVTELSGNVSLETAQTGWTGTYNTNSVVSRVQGGFDGTWAVQIAPKSGTTGPAGVNNAAPFWVPGTPGVATAVNQRYVGSAWVKASVANQSVSLMVRETTPGGTGVSFTTTTLTLPDTAWHLINAVYLARNAGDSIRYSLFGTFTSSSNKVLGDCLSLQTS